MKLRPLTGVAGALTFCAFVIVNVHLRLEVIYREQMWGVPPVSFGWPARFVETTSATYSDVEGYNDVWLWEYYGGPFVANDFAPFSIVLDSATALFATASVLVTVETWFRRNGAVRFRFRISSIAIATCWIALYLVIVYSVDRRWALHLVNLAQVVIVLAAGAVSWCAWHGPPYVIERLRRTNE